MADDNLYKRGLFTIDDAATFDGWTDGSEWNGWSCPCFELAVARNIAAYHGGKFDEVRRTFVFKDEEEYSPHTIQGEGQQIEVWAIGSGAWVWDEVSSSA